MTEFGYNFMFKSGEKVFAGVQTENMDISAKTKESMTKANKGKSAEVVIGHDITFSIGGLMEFGADGQLTTMNNDEILALALQTGPDAVLPFTWMRGAGKSYQGNAIITGYSESTDSENEANFSLNLKAQGDVKPVEVV